MPIVGMYTDTFTEKIDRLIDSRHNGIGNTFRTYPQIFIQQPLRYIARLQ